MASPFIDPSQRRRRRRNHASQPSVAQYEHGIHNNYNNGRQAAAYPGLSAGFGYPLGDVVRPVGITGMPFYTTPRRYAYGNISTGNYQPFNGNRGSGGVQYASRPPQYYREVEIDQPATSGPTVNFDAPIAAMNVPAFSAF
ncbi:hypothetical protein I4U23_013569 [Adineta vaga]|nr:hypothetical protein I4U23_013569 [Adineta vaga]